MNKVFLLGVFGRILRQQLDPYSISEGFLIGADVWDAVKAEMEDELGREFRIAMNIRNERG